MIHSVKSLLHGLSAALGILGVALLAGCAGTTSEMANGSIGTAEKSVAVASEGKPSTEGRAELKVAQDKLTNAKAAYTTEDYEEAKRLADEAAADADYARARATTARTQRMVSEVQESISMLRKEIEKSQ